MTRWNSVCAAFATLAACSDGIAQEPRIEQARQFQAARPGGQDLTNALTTSILETTAGEDIESFGIQQILREEERLRYFRVAAEVSAFRTNNVALTRNDERRDSFLLAAFSADYRRPLPRGFQFDAGLRFSMFRYSECSQLDFNSIDVGAGVSYRTQKLGGLDLALRYNYNELISAPSADTFFKNHTITSAVQKAVEFSQAHHAYVGASAQAGFADPKEAERSEFAAFVGYHLQATSKLEADLLYRYAYYIYSEGDRADHNQTLSLALRYRFTEWFSIFTTGFTSWNRSHRTASDYDAANAGVGLTVSLQF